MVDPQHPLQSLALQVSFALPLAGTAALLFGGGLRRSNLDAPKRWPGILSLVVFACSLVLSVFAAFATRNSGAIALAGGEWIPGFGPALSFRLDWLSAWLLVLLEIIGFMVMLYSLGYMRQERDQRRYFGGLLFFVAMMKLVILSGSYLLLFAGWEGVGLASYILIAFHFERPLAAHAATKAFVVNRIGDAGFMLALIALALACGSTNFATVAAAAPHMPHGTLVLICSMLVIGAMGKSAQFPLHIWLPDAMEGPTPVSALIHSATMVCAGVYLLARSSDLLILTPEVGVAVSILGAITALFGATVALAENDIKRVLAYSTISQIGFMFIALGVGAARAGMFHVVTHAFFKSLLFLGAGSVIHALHGEQNMAHMGGLRQRLPVTFGVMTVGALTLAGIPGLSSFFSKDLILEASFESGHLVLTAAAALTSLLTAIYAWRLIAVTFLGAPRGHHLPAREGPATMRVPMGVLACCCILVGWIFVPIHWRAWPGMVLSAALAVAGVGVAWYVYIASPDTRASIDARFAPVTKALRNRWYIDAAFEDHFVEGVVLRIASGAAAMDTVLVDGGVNAVATLSGRASAFTDWFDFRFVDGGVRLVTAVARFFSWPFRAVQSGFVQSYVLIFIAGALAALGFCLVR